MSYDRELTEEATRAGNRLHDLLLSTCPALEAHLAGKRIQSQLYLAVLARYGGCHGLKKAGRGNVRRWAKARKGMGPAALAKIDELFEAVSRQTVSLPGLGAVTCATFLSEVGDVSRFGSAAKLAAYAGLAPRVRQSGTTVHSVTKPRGGNRRLKRVLVLSASKSILFCDESRAYYERKRSEGRSYGSAVTALARRRLNVMYAMLRDGSPTKRITASPIPPDASRILACPIVAGAGVSMPIDA